MRGADVFVTNYRHDALERLGLDWKTVSALAPRLVYAHLTGYGQEGPDRDRAGYDIGAFWARAGISVLLAQAGGDPVGSRGGFGDHITASHGLAGILAALYAREKTRPRAARRRVSCCAAASTRSGFDISQQLAFGAVAQAGKREESIVPTVSSFKAGDDRWVWLLGVEADRHWPRLCEGLDRADLKDDPRFATAGARRENAREMMRILDEQFAKRPLAEWLERFDAVDLWWAPVNTPADVTRDAQALAVGAIVDVPDGQGGTQKSVGSPVRFSAADVTPRGPVPQVGEHTATVLAELGVSADAHRRAAREPRDPVALRRRRSRAELGVLEHSVHVAHHRDPLAALDALEQRAALAPSRRPLRAARSTSPGWMPSFSAGVPGRTASTPMPSLGGAREQPGAPHVGPRHVEVGERLVVRAREPEALARVVDAHAEVRERLVAEQRVGVAALVVRALRCDHERRGREREAARARATSPRTGTPRSGRARPPMPRRAIDSHS